MHFSDFKFPNNVFLNIRIYKDMMRIGLVHIFPSISLIITNKIPLEFYFPDFPCELRVYWHFALAIKSFVKMRFTNRREKFSRINPWLVPVVREKFVGGTHGCNWDLSVTGDRGVLKNRNSNMPPSINNINYCSAQHTREVYFFFWEDLDLKF